MRSALRTGRTKPGSNCMGDCRTLKFDVAGKENLPLIRGKERMKGIRKLKDQKTN